MTHTRPKIVAAAASVAIVSASLFAFAQPAAAADQVACESYFSKVHCDLSTATGSASSERWTVNGSAWPAGDNLASISVSCWPGSLVRVAVSYVNNGASYSLSASVLCRSGAPQ